jgi:hypothetical protein
MYSGSTAEFYQPDHNVKVRPRIGASSRRRRKSGIPFIASGPQSVIDTHHRADRCDLAPASGFRRDLWTVSTAWTNAPDGCAAFPKEEQTAANHAYQSLGVGETRLEMDHDRAQSRTSPFSGVALSVVIPMADISVPRVTSWMIGKISNIGSNSFFECLA